MDNEWTCPECGREGNTRNFCGKCGTLRPGLDLSEINYTPVVNNNNNATKTNKSTSKFNHIEYDEDAYTAILNGLNSVDGSSISSACSDIESTVNSFPDSYSCNIGEVGSSIEENISLISSLSKMVNYSLLAYQSCDEALIDRLYSLVDSLFGDSDTSIGDFYKSIIRSSIEEENGILKYIDSVPDEYKYFSFLSTISVMYNKDDSFLSSFEGNYGIDQGVFTYLRQKNPELYQETKEMLIEKYGFTNNSIEQFFSIVDSVGCCNIAAGANAIALAFKDKPEEFEEIFGFSYYREDSNGNKVVNDVGILADYYIWINTENGGSEKVLQRDENGNLVINENAYDLDENGNYKKVRQGGSVRDSVDSYLQSKSDKISSNTVEVIKQKDSITSEDIKNNIMDILGSGKQAVIGMCSTGDSIDYIASFETYGLDGPHWVCVTGANDEGISVTSWGAKYFIAYDELSIPTISNLYSIDVNIN